MTARNTTDQGTVEAARAGAGGYRRLAAGPGEPHTSRTDLASAASDPGTPLLTIAHLSDLHVCDAQSPARVEYLDRWADPDCPARDELGEVGTYRAHEFLTAQVVAAMVGSVNCVHAGPIGGGPVQLAISTGDNTDNAQANELAWYLALLDGGDVVPDSGDPGRYEGIADDADVDDRFWHPEAERDDLPRSRFGFPQVPGLLGAARARFSSPGLALPWLAVHGNHDRMLQGTWPGEGTAGAVATGGRKAIALDLALDTDQIVDLMAALNVCDPVAQSTLEQAVQRDVTADPLRRIITREEFVAAHFSATAAPPGHGFRPDHRAYYRYDHQAAPDAPTVSLLVMDTVNEHGGYQGSLDVDQLAWLADELRQADDDGRYAVLASHPPLSTLVNDRVTGRVARRVLADELATELARHPSLVLWLNGHTHETTVTPHASWWEVTAPSLIDWPQQARIVELLRGDGLLTIAATMIDHSGDLPWTGSIDSPAALAGLSRELAANDWQWRERPLEHHIRAGGRDERNVLLTLRDPRA